VNTTEFLMISSAIVPDRAAMVFEGRTITYGEFSERVNALANALAELGVKKGDMVAMLQVNCPEFIEAYNAAAKLGAIYVPLNFRARKDELSYMLNNCEAKVLFVGERYVEMVREMKPDLARGRDFHRNR